MSKRFKEWGKIYFKVNGSGCDVTASVKIVWKQFKKSLPALALELTDLGKGKGTEVKVWVNGKVSSTRIMKKKVNEFNLLQLISFPTSDALNLKKI